MRNIMKIAIVAFFVSISAKISFEFLTDGFIVAMSPVVMAIFIYCFEELPAAHIACLSGIFSPITRMITEIIVGKPLGTTLILVLPDMAFFFSYAAIYTAIYLLIFRAPKKLSNFPYAIFFSDFLSNLVEIGCRSVIIGHHLYSLKVLAILSLVAVVRTAIITMVVVAIEAYGRILITQEREAEYEKLLVQTATISEELHIMNKNVNDVEATMKQAYDLYYRIKDDELPSQLIKDVLSIAKNTHEIKGDYRNVLDVLNEVFMEQVKNEELRMSEIISLERSNATAMIKKNGYDIDISTKILTDFVVPETFLMMSLLRNLLTNSIEAIGDDSGKITVTVKSRYEPGEPQEAHSYYLISVKDNGPGIPPEAISDVFMESYSTKFNPKTGNIHRGLGLSLVKDYVENEMHGSICIKSEPRKQTEFLIRIPMNFKES